MTVLTTFPCCVVLAAVLPAQDASPVLPEQQPETRVMALAARNLARTSKASEEAKAEAGKLIEEVATLQDGEARRKLAHAITLLNGEAWEQKTELAWSLALKVDTELRGKRCATRFATRGRVGSKSKLLMIRGGFEFGCEMTVLVWMRVFSMKGARDIGDCRVCANAPKVSADNWKSGAKTGLARSWN